MTTAVWDSMGGVDLNYIRQIVHENQLPSTLTSKIRVAFTRAVQTVADFLYRYNWRYTHHQVEETDEDEPQTAEQARIAVAAPLIKPFTASNHRIESAKRLQSPEYLRAESHREAKALPFPKPLEGIVESTVTTAVHIPEERQWVVHIEMTPEKRREMLANRIVASALVDPDSPVYKDGKLVFKPKVFKPLSELTRRQSLAVQIYKHVEKGTSRESVAFDAYLGRFAEKNERQYSINEICEAAGVTRQAFNSYTGSQTQFNINPRMQVRQLEHQSKLEKAVALYNSEDKRSVKLASEEAGISTTALYSALHERGLELTKNSSWRKRQERIAQANDLYYGEHFLVIPPSERIRRVAESMGVTERTARSYLQPVLRQEVKTAYSQAA